MDRYPCANETTKHFIQIFLSGSFMVDYVFYLEAGSLQHVDYYKLLFFGVAAGKAQQFWVLLFFVGI